MVQVHLNPQQVEIIINVIIIVMAIINVIVMAIINVILFKFNALHIVQARAA